MLKTHQYCSFQLDNLLFGVDVKHVQEVLRFQEMTTVPLAPASVSGLLNLRGNIVVAVDLRQRLGLSERPADQPPMHVVVQTNEGPVSLLVDEVGDMFEVEEVDFERPPETMQGPGRELIVGIYKLGHRLLLVLDPDKAVDLSNEAFGGAVSRNPSQRGHQTNLAKEHSI